MRIFIGVPENPLLLGRNCGHPKFSRSWTTKPFIDNIFTTKKMKKAGIPNKFLLEFFVKLQNYIHFD